MQKRTLIKKLTLVCLLVLTSLLIVACGNPKKGDGGLPGVLTQGAESFIGYNNIICLDWFNDSSDSICIPGHTATDKPYFAIRNDAGEDLTSCSFSFIDESSVSKTRNTTLSSFVGIDNEFLSNIILKNGYGRADMNFLEIDKEPIQTNNALLIFKKANNITLTCIGDSGKHYNAQYVNSDKYADKIEFIGNNAIFTQKKVIVK